MLVEGHSTQVCFENVEAALIEPDTQLRLFGKPEVNGQRRMGVALAKADTVKAAVEKAKKASAAINVTL